jgi:hypothetical protein
MFDIFGKKQQDTTVAFPVTPQPTEAHYALTEAQQNAFDSMATDSDGFVRLDDVTHGLLRQQSQYISRYVDNRDPERSPFLADGLKINIDSPSYHEYTIHKADVLEFVARVRAFRNRSY